MHKELFVQVFFQNQNLKCLKQLYNVCITIHILELINLIVKCCQYFYVEITKILLNSYHSNLLTALRLFHGQKGKSDETKRSPSQIHSALKAMMKADRAEHTMNKTLALSLFKKPTRPKKSYWEIISLHHQINDSFLEFPPFVNPSNLISDHY